jgi:arabinose-5-phosphate isomerase
MASEVSYVSIFKSVLEQEAEALSLAKEKIDQNLMESLVRIFDHLKTNQGSLIFCGVGKSGLIAQKIAATFSSLGLSSWFLHPTEALHGDMGRVQSRDAMVLISKSGTTEEIIKMFPYLSIPTENLIAMCGNAKTEIAKNCGVFLDCSIEKEACLNNLAPTTSTTLTLAMGDAMAVLYENWSGLSKESFAKNHPGGLLGKSLLLKVAALMVPKNQCAIVKANTLMKDVLLAMTTYPTGMCCVVDEQQKLIGIVVEGDIRRFLTTHSNLLEVAVSQVMNKKPKSIHPEILAFDALNMMEMGEKQIYVLPVIDQDQLLLGVLRLHDLMKAGLTK